MNAIYQTRIYLQAEKALSFLSSTNQLCRSELLQQGPYLSANLQNSVDFFSSKMVSQTITVKPVLSGHSKIDKTKILMMNGSLMKVESIAECSHWSILQYF